MPRTPTKRLEKVQFYEDHIEVWSTNATAIGTTTTLVTSLETKTQAARDAYNAQQLAKQAAETATEVFKNAVTAMNNAGQGIIKQVEAMAQTTGNPNVYTLAQIAAPATPTSQGDPSEPYDFKVQVGTTGTLALSWKNSNAAGSVYSIYRRLGSTGDFVDLGGVGRKKFTDDTVPAGTKQVQYQIRAERPTGVSDWALYIVNLGVEEGMALVSKGTPAKLAA